MKNKDSFKLAIKANANYSLIKKEIEIKNFIKRIEDNPDLLYVLSNDRLEILINYYCKLILDN